MNNKIKIIIILSLIIIVAYGYWNYNSFANRIDENIKISSGKIINYEFNYKSSKGYNYIFVMENSTYYGFYSIAPRIEQLINKSFPVIYNSKNPKEHLMLIFPKDFEKHNLPFPDSLKWVTQYE